MNIHSEDAVTPSAPSTAADPRTDKRRAILEAALELFVERGFHGTAVPAVARSAEVGAGTIYRYFENKEALVNELYRQWKTKLVTTVASDLSTDCPPRDIFACFWNRTVEFARRHPRAFAFLELHHHASYLDDESRQVEERVLLLAKGLLATMQERRAIKPISLPLIMHLVHGALIGLVRGAWEGRYPLDDEHVAAAEQCAWEAIRQ